MENPFKLFFRLPGYNEEEFVGQDGLNYDLVKSLEFEACKEGTGGLTVFRKPNDLGGFDYLPLVDRFYPGNMPEVNPEKDRWMEGYDRGVVLFVLGEAQNRQYVQHSADGTTVTKGEE